MYKNLLIGLLLLVTSTSAFKPTVCKLTVVNDPDNPSRTNQNIDIYPTVYSSPVDNLNNQLFSIFKAEPLDACTSIQEPHLTNYPKISNYPYLIVIDGSIGVCGVRRRIQMAKNAGAKGLIILEDDLNSALEPYGDFQDNTFLVFITKKNDQNKALLLPTSYILVSISSPNQQSTKPQIELWISTLDTKSYQLMSIWDQTLREIPVILNTATWKPRYALWGCNSGLFAPNSACVTDAKYLSSCACGGQFCSPETSIEYKAADATVKQDIRQKIIYSSYPTKYLPYILGFKANCLKTFQTEYYAEDCAASQMMNLGIDHSAVETKLDDFMGTCKGDIYQSLLLDRNRYSQLDGFPAVIVDRQPIEYNSKRDLQVKLCKKLGLDQQEGCVKVMRVNTIANFTINVLFFILIIGGIVAIVAVLLLVYRKTVRKQMQKEMKMQVSASVEHYFALTQTK